MIEDVAVIGAGGHAKVVIGTLQAAGYRAVAVFDDNPSKWGAEVLGVRVKGEVKLVAEADYAGAVIAIGDNATRCRLAQQLPGLNWLTVVHPHAWVHPSAQLGAGTVVFAGAVVQPEARVGHHVIINTGASIDHECILHDFVHVAPGAHIAGRVEVGEGAFVGIGSSITQCCRIGKWTIIGAGAAVVADLPAYVTAVGVPARIIKHHVQLQEEQHD